ncbi:hypothetical protein [Herminiimonas sp. CN]|uniref:hypothetical protein n=1 Tax=Herminiimonas sp. CN TaxID=1349818 RepID=UPI0012DD17B3|nr:hypothetical protein [Herminiimonas sp. CN]
MTATNGADHAHGESRVELAFTEAFGSEPVGSRGYAFLTNPRAGKLTASGTRREPNAFRGSIRGKLTANCGGVAKLGAESGNLMATGIGVIIGRAYLAAQPGKLTASGTAGGIASARMVQPGKSKVVAYSGAVLSVRIGGQGKITAGGTQGSVGRAIMRLPLCRFAASGHAENFGVARLVGPRLRPAGSGAARLVNPGYRLVAYGSAVVALEYEAYAVNLLTGLDRNPQNQFDPDVREVTHYTNYPFTQIVRFHDHYYGVAADGLYLLEGDTDAGAPIAWSLRTALTDAGSKQLKRVRSVYIGARLISQVEVTLVVGEEQNLTYSYTTPRSSTAQNYRQVFGKGVRTRYFALELADPAGGFIEIDSLDLENEILERAI